MIWNIKKFNQLDTNILYSILKLRSEVFVLEQKCMDPEKTLEVLSTCKCCKRHQTNRPKDLNIFFEETNSTVQQEEREILLHHICSCPCRNYARWIIRCFYLQHLPS